MIKLDKKLVDEVIRLTKKYLELNNQTNLDALFEAKHALKEKATWRTWREVDLLFELARYAQGSGKGTYDDIYRALAAFGIIVEEV